MRTLTNLLVRRGCANIGRQPPVVVQHREMVIRTSKQRRKIRIVTTACVLFCLVGFFNNMLQMKQEKYDPDFNKPAP